MVILPFAFLPLCCIWYLRLRSLTYTLCTYMVSILYMHTFRSFICCIFVCLCITFSLFTRARLPGRQKTTLCFPPFPTTPCSLSSPFTCSALFSPSPAPLLPALWFRQVGLCHCLGIIAWHGGWHGCAHAFCACLHMPSHTCPGEQWNWEQTGGWNRQPNDPFPSLGLLLHAFWFTHHLIFIF